MNTIALVEVLLALRRCDYNWLCRDVLIASASRSLNGCDLIDDTPIFDIKPFVEMYVLFHCSSFFSCL